MQHIPRNMHPSRLHAPLAACSKTAGEIAKRLGSEDDMDLAALRQDMLKLAESLVAVADCTIAAVSAVEDAQRTATSARRRGPFG